VRAGLAGFEMSDYTFPAMVRVNKGMFLMGSAPGEIGHAPSEAPRHEVRIGYDFELGATPISFAQWDAAIAAGAKLHNADDCGWGRDQRPVVNVSWRDVQTYLNWINRLSGLKYRLPTEAEWEYACRAGSLTSHPHGNDDGALDDHAWSARNAQDQTQPVGQLKPNRYGLHDMQGNVWEWCEDTWHESYRVVTPDGYQANAPLDGSAWMQHGDPDCRALRGGSWGDVGPQVFRSADRCAGAIGSRRNDVGFRLARTLD
jgi:formylglycine-generating enzyme required for sulfatase activity